MTGAAEADFIEATGYLGLSAHRGERPSGQEPDLLLDVGGQPVLVELKEAATVTPQQAERIVASATGEPLEGCARVVVADRVVAAAREVLRSAGWGWLDRRGHLRVVAPGVFVDTSVGPLTEPARVDDEPLGRQVGKEVATALLLAPQRQRGVRALAGEVRRAASSVSDALAALRARGLVDDDGLPAVPALFWELADHWPTAAQSLQRAPTPGDGAALERLQIGWDDIEGTTGWALTDTLAAAAYGAPLGVGSAHPPDFWVPNAQVVRHARLVLGTADHAERGCTVRVAPVAWACTQRVDGAARGLETHWPLAQPLFVALDLAVDLGRGQEIVAAWHPPEPWTRVW